MEDIEIMIALECHDGDVERCLRCPYRTSDDCYVKLSNDALDLINRQKSKIKALQMDNEQLQSDIANANMNLYHAQAEIDRFADIFGR